MQSFDRGIRTTASRVRERKKHSYFLQMFVFVGVPAAYLVTPADVIKTRLQVIDSLIKKI